MIIKFKNIQHNIEISLYNIDALLTILKISFKKSKFLFQKKYKKNDMHDTFLLTYVLYIIESTIIAL